MINSHFLRGDSASCGPRRVICFMAAGLWLALAEPVRGADAGAPAPRVWPGAAVNAFVLPYSLMGMDEDPLNVTARELTQLTFDNVFFNMVKYRSVGITSLEENSFRRMQFDLGNTSVAKAVLSQLLEQSAGAETTVRPNHALVLLWGFIYEEGDDVYVQSYVRFLRRDAPDRVSLTLRPDNGEKLQLTGQIPDQAVAFAPRKLSSKNLTQIRQAFERGARIYSAPAESSSNDAFVGRPDDRFRYYVTGTRDGWLQIAGSDDRHIRGWIKADAHLGDESLDNKMPEIAFIDAAVGYLRYRMALDGAVESDDLNRDLRFANASLARYEAIIQDRRFDSGDRHLESPMATAVTKVLRGNLLLLSANDEPNVEAVAAAREYYQSAVDVVPYSAEIRNLRDIAGAYLAQQKNWAVTPPGEVAMGMRASLALDPASATILDNLENLYAYMETLSPQQAGVEPQQLKKNLDAVRRVRKSLSAR